CILSFFFFTPPARTSIFTLSLHDALPIFDSSSCICSEQWGSGLSLSSAYPVESSSSRRPTGTALSWVECSARSVSRVNLRLELRSEEHTSELQSRFDLVCRLLLEKKKKKK